MAVQVLGLERADRVLHGRLPSPSRVFSWMLADRADTTPCQAGDGPAFGQVGEHTGFPVASVSQEEG